MPFPPWLAPVVAKPENWKKGLVVVGSVLAGVGGGVEFMGNTMRGVESQATASSEAFIELSRICGDELADNKNELSRLEIELAICMER